MTKLTVFISYSHDSPEHADRVLAFANRLVQDGVDCILDQYETSPAEGWPRWMDKHIRSADFVLMVCTETYFRRVMGEEKPGTGLGVKWEGNLIYQHIYNADTTNTRLIPLLFEGCKLENIPTPLQGATYYHMDAPQGYENLYRRLTDQPRVKKPALGKLKELPPRERKQDFFAVKISLAKLPCTSPDLFGREKELKALDVAWEDPKTNVLALVAWGGVGKSALVNKWLLQMGQDNYRGAQRVFGWSFYSQGAAEGRQVSAEQFIDAALRWFGDPDSTQGSPWDKGQRLAELVKQQLTLLVLDGLEPLQNPTVEMGRLKDPGLCCLLRELARQNPGLVVITTRLPVGDLKDFLSTSTVQKDMEDLSPQAGAAYLKHLGVKGTEAELQQASQDFGGHALALTLLGSYLRVVYSGDVRQRDKIQRLMEEKRQGAHARRVMHAYERWFQRKPEMNILLMMGLFDRPAERGALEALRKKPAIDGLTDALQELSYADWQYAVENLRTLRLLAAADLHQPDTLDCHPLLREHIGDGLRTNNLKGWHEAHSRLYEYYKSIAKEYPNSIEEIAPLYAAVAHGCQAGRYQETMVEVYQPRILRKGGEHFSWRRLGLFGTDLAALAGFFDQPWSTLVLGLQEHEESLVLALVGLHLRALGRLPESAQPMQAALVSAIAQKDWFNAARPASNLSELSLIMGDLTQALAYARQAVELSDRSGHAWTRMGSRTYLADALHRAGRIVEAEAAFREAEEIQKKQTPKTPLIYGPPGFHYCDLLLSQGKYSEVQSRAAQTLEWREEYGFGLLSIALDHLSLGLAQLLSAQREGTGDYLQAATYLEHAMDGLRQAGLQDFLPLGLLARAELYRLSGTLDNARRDLDEAFFIATRCGMRLHEADCHLEYAPLYLALREKDKARQSLAKAEQMIQEMGYHRRDRELEELRIKIDTDDMRHNNTLKTDPASGAA